MAANDEFAPPPGLPKLLTEAEALRLLSQGYLTITLPPRVSAAVSDVFSHAYDFFDLPLDAKQEWFPSAVRVDSQDGYICLPGEKEYLSLRYAHRVTATVGGEDAHGQAGVISEAVQESTRTAWRELSLLLCRALNDVTAHLSEVSPDAWEQLVPDSFDMPQGRAESTPTVLRVFRYEPRSGVAEPHRDLGLLTLCVCRGRGLQVLSRQRQKDGEAGTAEPVSDGWRDAGEATLLVGNALRVLSTNRVPAGLHRVVPTETGRHSLVFALRPSARGLIDLAKWGGHGAISSLDFWQTLTKQGVNINAPHHDRAIQRAQLAQRRGETVRKEEATGT